MLTSWGNLEWFKVTPMCLFSLAELYGLTQPFWIKAASLFYNVQDNGGFGTAHTFWQQKYCTPTRTHRVSIRCVSGRQQRTNACIIPIRQGTWKGSTLVPKRNVQWCVKVTLQFVLFHHPYLPTSSTHVKTHTQPDTCRRSPIEMNTAQNAPTRPGSRTALQYACPICLNRPAVCLVSLRVSTGILNRVQLFTLTQPHGTQYLWPLWPCRMGSIQHSILYTSITRFCNFHPWLTKLTSTHNLHETHWPRAAGFTVCWIGSSPLQTFRCNDWYFILFKP